MSDRDSAGRRALWPRRWAQASRGLIVAAAVLYASGLAGFLVLRATLGDHPWWLGLANNFTAYAFLPLCVLLPACAAVSRGRLTAALSVEALLGVWWVGCSYLPARAPAPAGAPLRVVTFNVWGANPHRSRVRAWLEQTRADIVVLQEVGGRRFEELTTQLSVSYPYAYARRVPGHDWMNALLSRHPIASREDVVPSDPRAPIQRLTVHARGQSLAVYVVHLDMPLHSRPGVRYRGFRFVKKAVAYDDSARNRQIAALLARIETETLPFVVAGDFNLSDQSWTYRALRARMGDAFRAVGAGATWPANRELPVDLPPLIRIDYVWHSTLLQPVAAQTGPPLGSDHLPVVADFVLPASPQS